jgi:uncharacterized BrkB/YihY/UPF0761 family membrane protein
MMISFYFTVIPLLIVCIYIFGKYLYHKKDLTNPELVSDFHNFDDAKEMVFQMIDELRSLISKNTKIVLHWVLHLFVIILGLVSDITDFLYAKARDFFLKTATKEQYER